MSVEEEWVKPLQHSSTHSHFRCSRRRLWLMLKAERSRWSTKTPSHVSLGVYKYMHWKTTYWHILIGKAFKNLRYWPNGSVFKLSLTNYLGEVNKSVSIGMDLGGCLAPFHCISMPSHPPPQKMTCLIEPFNFGRRCLFHNRLCVNRLGVAFRPWKMVYKWRK